jgi:hypothetical protein
MHAAALLQTGIDFANEQGIEVARRQRIRIVRLRRKKAYFLGFISEFARAIA